MTKDQIEKAAKLKKDIAAKGLLSNYVARKFGMTNSRLSRILTGKESSLSNLLLDKIIVYIAAVNTNDINDE